MFVKLDLCGFKCHTHGCKGYAVNDDDMIYYQNQLTLIVNSLIEKYYTRTYKQVGNSYNNTDFSWKSDHGIN